MKSVFGATLVLSLWGAGFGCAEEAGWELTFAADERDVREIMARNPDADPVLWAVEVVEKRLELCGVEPVGITRLERGRIRILLPKVDESTVAVLEKLLAMLGQLEFRIVAPSEKETEERARRDREGDTYSAPPGFRWYPPRPQRDDGGNEAPSGEPDRLVEIPEYSAQQEVDYTFGEIQKLEGRQRLLTEKVADPATPDRAALQSELDAIPFKLAERNSQLEEQKHPLWDALKKDYFTGQHLSSSALLVRPDPRGFGFVVAFAITDARKLDFTNFTGRNIKRQMAIIIDGQVESSPVIRDVLPGEGIISGGQAGGFTEREAKNLVILLHSESLPIRLAHVSTKRLPANSGDK